VGFVEGSHLGGSRLHTNTAIAAVVADTILNAAGVGDVVIDDGVVVNIGDMANVGNVAVVIEIVTAPVAAEVANADVAEAVVNATVEANVGAPVAVVEAVVAAVVAPVGRGPERAVIRRRSRGGEGVAGRSGRRRRRRRCRNPDPGRCRPAQRERGLAGPGSFRSAVAADRRKSGP
jgi:hypothetical protein